MEKEHLENEKARNEAETEEQVESPEADKVVEQETVSDESGTSNDELSEMKDRYLRLYSEFENFRRRTAREKLDVIQNANAELLTQLLPVLDDMERALKVDEDNKQDDNGLVLIFNKFRKTLENAGVKEIDASEGAEFDVEVHEAISQILAPNKKLKGKVVDVVEKGYYLKEKVIRFAKVVVGS